MDAAGHRPPGGRRSFDEGLSLASLEGDGRVILQSMTLEGLANVLKKAQGGDKPGPTGGLFSTHAG
ncbi:MULTISPECIES: hypothetical protein [Streptomycetaceae]|uniref:Uncharacterized protein n=1 Tax=Streptantibioticus cattleyicolor (strain ATCC 35852 / DSM 46488 / JCM 4925 / NBRC 14057 / NRRL 8057) TaxID=1003195 RepID=F8JXQ1_STREN|nr:MULTISPECIES: hypothetical protein [Streptomycetaceae]AEW97154.1 hypothetical protein SCATT_47830 [Streptantibioticus cattleyicolor NRRL 8057 = DSM 46488]MYS61611.1 hypothetical protein [Streptomyces sp. SID5468]CCB77477.1 conserved protein of unknown function [Streptantibioticus cattleyicolor NRRL 8057 = DSM 46488]